MKILYVLVGMLATLTLCAETTEVMLSNSMKCTKEELMRFFPHQIVHALLIKANIPEDKADAIAKELSDRNKDFARILEEKSEKITPNPFKNLSQRDLANQIYQQTLYEVFANTLRTHGITDEEKIQSLLSQLKEDRTKLFMECIRKQNK